jgi:hypothetical protein
MTTAYQLPDDVGQKSVTRNGQEVQADGTFPAGQTTADQSIPIVQPVEGYNLSIIDNYRFKTEVERDLLGFPRVTRPWNYLTKSDQFELSKQDWIYDITGLNERPQDDSTQSARWTQISNAKAVYDPVPNGEIRYNDSANSAQLVLNSNDGGFQRARIVSRRRYRYQPGRIVRASLATRLSLADTPISCKRLWGVGDSRDGFFVQTSGDGEGDRFAFIYRNSAGNGLLSEKVIPRSEWNGDPLDGTGKSKAKLDFTKTFMTLFEWGWYGASDCRVYFYLVDDDEDLPTSITQIPRARWILAHDLILADTAIRTDLVEDDGGGSQRSYDVPSLSSPNLPIWVEINNSGNIARSEFIERYGASVIVDGGSEDKAEIKTIDSTFGVDANVVVGGPNSGKGTSVLTVRSKEHINNADGTEVENLLTTKPLVLNVSASELTELQIFRDPTMQDPTDVGHINGQLPYQAGDYVSPFDVVPVFITSFDDQATEIAIVQEPPTGEYLTIDTAYSESDLRSVEISVVDKRIVASGSPMGSFIVGPQGASLDMTKLFGATRELITTEFDAPTEFPIETSSLEIVEFNATSGLITVADAFPLRLYLNQRVTKGSTDYYVHTIDSKKTFTLKAAKVDVTPVTSGLFPDDTLVAHYELGLTKSISSRLNPIYRTELVFVAKPFAATHTSLSSATQYDAEWMNLVNATSSNTYTVQSSSTVNIHITNGVS